MAPVIAKSNCNSVGTKKKTLGRRKVEMKKVEAPDRRQVTFSKRKKGLFDKAELLSSLTGTDIAAFVVSESGRVFGFGNPSCDAVADRYLAGMSATQNANDQNDGMSSRDGIGSMTVESIPSTSSSSYSQNDNIHYQNDNVLLESMIFETVPSRSNLPQSNGLLVESDKGETGALSSSCSDIRVREGDGYLNLLNNITVLPAAPCNYNYPEWTNGSEAAEMSGKMIEEMIEGMMNVKEVEVPICNEFLDNFVTALLPTKTSNYYTSLLVMEDEDEFVMDNRGLGNCYFNPYEDWRCGGISH